MAPPPPASMPLAQRLMVVAQTLQFAWFLGHVTLILAVLRYSLSWITLNFSSRMARFSYRLALLAAMVTYGIVVYKTLRARARSGAQLTALVVFSLLSDENVQYLVLASVWLLSPQSLIALLPYSVYSVFHVATYMRSTVIPTIAPPAQAAPAAGSSPNAKSNNQLLADSIGAFVKEYYDTSMTIVASLEVLMWFRLLTSAILFVNRSWILLFMYTVFIRARVNNSIHVQKCFASIETRTDNLLGHQGTPPTVKMTWDATKAGVKQFYSVTDASKYFNRAAAPKKTS